MQSRTDEVAVQISQHDLVRVAGGHGLLGDLVTQVELPGAAVPVDSCVADAGQEVGPKVEFPADQPRPGGEDLGEALGDGVLGVFDAAGAIRSTGRRA